MSSADAHWVVRSTAIGSALALVVSACSPGAPGGGIGGAGGTSGMPREEPFWSDVPLLAFSPPRCVNPNAPHLWDATYGLQTAFPIDFVALREARPSSDPPAPLIHQHSSTGIACRTALDQEACQTALAATAEGLELNQRCGGAFAFECTSYLVSTAGDAVRRYLTKAEYPSLLGPIDTPAEALLLVHDVSDLLFNIRCGRLDLSGVRKVSDGYQVIATQKIGFCPSTLARVLLHVSSDARITELRRNVGTVGGCE